MPNHDQFARAQLANDVLGDFERILNDPVECHVRRGSSIPVESFPRAALILLRDHVALFPRLEQ